MREPVGDQGKKRERTLRELDKILILLLELELSLQRSVPHGQSVVVSRFELSLGGRREEVLIVISFLPGGVVK
jgi:hypothetical protein